MIPENFDIRDRATRGDKRERVVGRGNEVIPERYGANEDLKRRHVG